jgi:glutamate dehydrogenase
MNSALDIVEVAQGQGVGVELTGTAYFLLGERLGLNWIRDQIEGLAIEGHWQAVARSTLRDNLYSLQRGLTAKVLAGGKVKEAEAAVDGWLSARRQQIEYLQQTFKEMRNATADFPTLSVALQAVRRLAEAR